jgi:hypothetical protein
MTINQNKQWHTLILPFNKQLYDALQQQHHAARNLALAGRYLLPQQPDDSNTSMQYLPDNETLVSNELANSLRLGLHLSKMELQMLDQEEELINAFVLDGKNRDETFDEMKRLLQDGYIDISKIRNELHFEIPFHPVANGAAFDIRESKYFNENAMYRHNSEIILHEVITDYPDAAPIRVWPHHFDTGTFIPLDSNEQGTVSKSISLGWAIPDNMAKEPYYYLSFWTAEKNEIPENLNPLPAGKWMMPKWNGAVLQHSDILQYSSADKQYKLVKSFFETGIPILLKYLSKYA